MAPSNSGALFFFLAPLKCSASWYRHYNWWLNRMWIVLDADKYIHILSHDNAYSNWTDFVFAQKKEKKKHSYVACDYINMDFGCRTDRQKSSEIAFRKTLKFDFVSCLLELKRLPLNFPSQLKWLGTLLLIILLHVSLRMLQFSGVLLGVHDENWHVVVKWWQP